MSTMLQRMLLPENFFDTKVGVRLNSPQSCCSFFSRFPFGTKPSLAPNHPTDVVFIFVLPRSRIGPTNAPTSYASPPISFPTQLTCAPLAPAHVVYPLAMLVNTVWFGTFVGFFWYYSSPSMYLVRISPSFPTFC